MSRPVKDSVDKLWAKDAREILTGCAPDITALFQRLRTMTSASIERYKTQAAKDRFQRALDSLREALNFGWAHGFNGEQTRFTRPAIKKGTRRVGVLIPLAVQAGIAIGKAQAKKIAAAHPVSADKKLTMRHEHPATASQTV